MTKPVAGRVYAAGGCNLADFFAPTHRFQGLHRDDETDVDCRVSEVLLQGTIQDLLIAGWAWKDVLRVTDGRIVWIDSDTFLAERSSLGRTRSTHATAPEEWMGSYEECWFSLGVPHQELSGNLAVHNVGIYSVGLDKAKATLSVLMQFLALEDGGVGEIVVDASGLTGRRVPFPIEAVDLRSILVKRERLRRFTLKRFILQPDQILTLLKYASKGTTVAFEMCDLEDGGRVLADCVRDNQNPAALSLRWTSFDDHSFRMFCDAIRVNTSLRTLHLVHCCKNSVQINALTVALTDNQGLCELRLVSGGLADESVFRGLCRAVGRHATLEVLEMRSCVAPWQSLSLSRETARYKQLVEMLQNNTVLQEIRFDFQQRNAHDDSSLLAMRALLLRNIYLRKRLPSLAAVYPSCTQLALVGRALYSVNHRPNELWMLLSGVMDFLLPNVASSSKRFDCCRDRLTETQSKPWMDCL
jgi:hypothetical protein